ncbi:hypothetical protein N0V95_004751 [Ascochyta clinopodiicola]|nr:hypothetical protein N0V95_004751 [Ascochyta clinopodiicola]
MRPSKRDMPSKAQDKPKPSGIPGKTDANHKKTLSQVEELPRSASEANIKTTEDDWEVVRTKEVLEKQDEEEEDWVLVK